VVVGIIVVLAAESFDALKRGLTTDLAPLAAGTILTTAIGVLVALPFGLLAAIYLSEFASKRARSFLKPILDMLAGLPTVAYGYFALAAITPLLERSVPGLRGSSALAAGLAMGIMLLPLVASRCDDALSAVSLNLREGAYALGAGKLATVTRVVLPTALAGIGAAVVLAAIRGLGETMIVTIAAGSEPNISLDPREPVDALTSFIARARFEGQARLPFPAAAALLLFTLALDALARTLSKSRSGGSR